MYDFGIMNIIFVLLKCLFPPTEAACKTRLDLIKVHAVGVLQDLKSKAENAFKDMNDWLGARFLKEMERYVTIILIGWVPDSSRRWKGTSQ